MNPEFMYVFRWISKALLLAGGVASTWFFFDYIRTANTKLAYTRMVLVLNFAIASVLWTQFLFNFFTRSVWAYIFLLVMFATVDLMLFYQIVLLHKARRDAAKRKHHASSANTSRREEDA